MKLKLSEFMQANYQDEFITWSSKWADLHREELAEDWQKARNGEPLEKIEPLI